MRRSRIVETEAFLLVTMNIQRCHDSRITPAGSFDLEVTIQVPFSSGAGMLRPIPYAQDKDWDKDWTRVTLHRRLTFDVFAKSSDPAARIIPPREIRPVVHNPDAITEVERWIESCADHVDCSTTSNVLLPTRVIEVLPIPGKQRLTKTCYHEWA